MSVPGILNPLAASRRIAEHYRGYLLSTFSPRRNSLRQEFANALTHGLRTSKGPYLQASPPFVRGVSIAELIKQGVLSSELNRLDDEVLPKHRLLYTHQEEAVRKAVTLRRNLIVSTGTGSGKTEAFLLPIIDHLLREKEAGTLMSPGVRALLLYPMNALANDQVKRLRNLLANFSEITFGRYVGETAHTQDRAEEDFRSRYPSERRVSNELISREQMQATPPHLLLTNYAMLEYLLLRPADSSLFDGDTGQHWRFIVLDEAHIYNGAQGTEIAMLMRRVRDRVNKSEPGRLQCFATSATLGRGRADYPALIKFGNDLIDEKFEWEDGDSDRQDVIEAQRQPLQNREARYELPQSLYARLQLAFRTPGASGSDLHAVVRAEIGDVASASPEGTPSQYLTELLAGDRNLLKLQTLLEGGAIELTEAAKRLFVGSDAEDDLVSLIDLAVAARSGPEDAPLIPARYHFFLRALEGAFICLHPKHPTGEPSLLLTRHERCPSCSRNGRNIPMFELSVCRNCGVEYLVGELSEEEDQQVLRQPTRVVGGYQYLLLGSSISKDEENEDESAASLESSGEIDSIVLCTGCGVVSESEAGCRCQDQPAYVRLTQIHPARSGDVLHSCAACSARTPGEVVYRFLTGTDAPVSVIASDLYQEIPASTDQSIVHRVGEGRKLLTFSDSRQDAAFFAPFLERTYDLAVQRRLIADAVRDFGDDRPRTDDLVVPLRKRAESCLVIDPDQGSVANRVAVNSWLMREILSLDRRQSLEGTGTAEITIAFPGRYEPPRRLLELGLAPEEIQDLIRLLLETVRASGAVTMPVGVDVRDELFAPRNGEIGIREETSEFGVLSWLPGVGMNRRLDILKKLFGRKGIDHDPRELLRGLWGYLTDKVGPWADVFVSHSDKQKGTLWRLSHERFEFIPAFEDHRPLRCGSCQRLWWRSIAGLCPTFRCQGNLEPIEDLSALGEDHYARLYRSIEPIGLAVQEHTAQWTPSKASAIQDEFVRGEVNVLSCSTTFELGVDVGEVQAVLMRNVPPSPSNYIQRAGRAGRRTDSAALVVTYAQRRSHDLTHFSEPRSMVEGTIAPPTILIDNPAIVRRHAHSVAFAAFERGVVEDGREEHREVAGFFSSRDGAPGDEEFISWLEERPKGLEGALDRIIPEETASKIGLIDWTWTKALVEPSESDPAQGWLRRAADEAREDLEAVIELLEEAHEKKQYGRAQHLERLHRTLSRRPLLGYLASRNVLPKYGFPVDVVELNLARSGDADAGNLDLSRDLKMAISEYAPGGEVVAAKAIWVSKGLGVRSSQTWPAYRWGVCGECGAFRHRFGDALEECKVCGSEPLAAGYAGSFIIPIFGFVGERQKKKPGEARPLRQAAVDMFFGAYHDADPEFVPVTGLGSRYTIEKRFGRQGRITVINRGPVGRGFRLCERCGYGEPAPTAASLKKSAQPHNDLRRPGKKCSGVLRHRHLGHQYLTDVLEIRTMTPMDDAAARSALYAMLEGTAALSIARDDVDGTLYSHSQHDPPSFVIFDSVPGGAGHVLRIGERLGKLFEAALARVEECECGEETSCYNCLRSYSNQPWHDILSRGAAAAILRSHLGQETSQRLIKADLRYVAADARCILEQVLEEGGSSPVIGYEISDPDGQNLWQLEAAWPERKTAILVDAQSDRDSWLEKEGWDARPAEAWTPKDLLAALGVHE